MGGTVWQIQYHVTSLPEDVDSSACAQDNDAVPQPQQWLSGVIVCVCVCFILLQLNTLLANSRTLTILTL